MRIWPIIFDSRPAYLSGRGRGGSLLLVPLGASVLIEHLQAWLEPITPNPLTVWSPHAGADADYLRWISTACPTARVMAAADELAESLASHEPSDVLLLIDPRCLPVRELELSELVRHYSAEPRVSHHLVAFETGVAGTRERVSFDAAGHVRGIVRHYEQATWPFVAGVGATALSVACGILGEPAIPTSLADLRQVLAARGVPSRDVPVEGGMLNLEEEAGLLAASERFIFRSTGGRANGRVFTGPLRVGEGHLVHASARFVGPVVLHPDTVVEENVTIVGPAVIGSGARIESRAIVAHAAIGPDCTVPAGSVVRDRAWFENGDEHATDDRARPYKDRLARLTYDMNDGDREAEPSTPARGRYVHVKRALDATIAALSLIILSPVFCVVALFVWLDSKGPVLYGDQREGLHGRVFPCWKFRTMRVGADAVQKDLKPLAQIDGPHFKLDRDPRVTRVGRILRTTNLDELPQLLNVLVGQMSLVGPRPSPFRENQICVPWRQARLSVRPGISGLWQVCRHDRSAGDFHQWIEYDVLYVQHCCLSLDVKIVAATIFTGAGKVAHVPSSWLIRTNPVHSVELSTVRFERTSRASAPVASA